MESKAADRRPSRSRAAQAAPHDAAPPRAQIAPAYRAARWILPPAQLRLRPQPWRVPSPADAVVHALRVQALMNEKRAGAANPARQPLARSVLIREKRPAV